MVEHLFITSFSCESSANHTHQEGRETQKTLSEPRDDESAEDISVSLQLGEPECKRIKLSDFSN